MRTTPIALAALFAAGLTSAALLRTSEPVLKGNDHTRMGKDVGAYWDALKEEKGINEAYEKVASTYEKLHKKALKPLDGEELLSSVADWQRIFFLAQSYNDRGVKKGKVEDRTYEDDLFGDYRMLIQTPKGYSSKSGPHPLLIVIPPAGKTPEEHLMEMWVEPVGKDSTIIAVCEMPTNELQWSEVGSADNHGGVDTVLLTLRSIKNTHAVDVDRTFLAGSGPGLNAAMRIATMYPHVFAGVIGRTGDLGDDISPANFGNLPTFFAGGGQKCSDFQTAAKDLGFENVQVETAATEADIWAWIAENPRQVHPTEITLAPSHAYNSQAYWLGIEGFDVEASPKISATVDRETNTITLTSEGITTATISFNDEILDLSQPVTVVCNGTPQQDLLPRNLRNMLNLAFASGDSGRVYVNKQSYDLAE